ncbi:hypothetical protein ACEXQE_19640 [Herbiconiux sp. P17]
MSSSHWSPRANQARILSDRLRIVVRALVVVVSAAAAVSLSVIAFAVQP